MTLASIFFGTVRILPTQKDAASNLGRFNKRIDPARKISRHVAELEAAGYAVTLTFAA